MQGKVALLCVVMLVWTGCVEGFRRGDTVHMTKRSNFREVTSDWSEMLGKHVPKFGFDKSVKLHALDPNEFEPERPYKIAFSVAGGRFITPWITISDGAGTYLQFIEFTFIYAGEELVEMKWKTDYNTDEHGSKIPEALYLHYNWQELKEKDIFAGLSVLFIGGFVLGGGVLLYIVLVTDAEDRRLKKSGAGSRPTPSFAFNPASSFVPTIRRTSATHSHTSSTSSSSSTRSVSPPTHSHPSPSPPRSLSPPTPSPSSSSSFTSPEDPPVEEEFESFVGDDGEMADFVGSSKND